MSMASRIVAEIGFMIIVYTQRRPSIGAMSNASFLLKVCSSYAESINFIPAPKSEYKMRRKYMFTDPP